MFTKFLSTALVAVVFAFSGVAAHAATYAELVMDARDGNVVRSRGADVKLHPASLTKMMTLYVAFQAVENGEISLDKKVRISRNAAAEPRSKLYLKSGSYISIRYLIRGAAIKSANDAATALAEAISGSEQAFAQRMTQTARAMGMKNTTFKNAHGLTASGHLSTPRDMAILVRHLMYDYPDYWNIFGRISTDAGIRTVTNTNQQLLRNYKGADGVKTGYTSAAGYNLAGSAHRGSERVIAIIFGAKSSYSRYRRMRELLDMGFDRIPTRTALIKPRRPALPTQAGGPIYQVAAPILRNGYEYRSVSGIERVANAIVPAAHASTSVRDLIASSTAPVRMQRPLMRNGGQAVAHIAPPSGLTVADLVRMAEAEHIAQPVRPVVSAPKGVIASVERPVLRGGYDRLWAIDLGAYKQQTYAKNLLTRLAPIGAGVQQVATTERAGLKLYQAQFVGLSEKQASDICSRIRAQKRICRPVPPES